MQSLIAVQGFNTLHNDQQLAHLAQVFSLHIEKLAFATNVRCMCSMALLGIREGIVVTVVASTAGLW